MVWSNSSCGLEPVLCVHFKQTSPTSTQCQWYVSILHSTTALLFTFIAALHCDCGISANPCSNLQYAVCFNNLQYTVGALSSSAPYTAGDTAECTICRVHYAVQRAECILEVQVQDAKGVGVIRLCKGATFQLNFSTNIVEHLKWSQGQHFVWAVNNDREPTFTIPCFSFFSVHATHLLRSYQNAHSSVTL